MPIPLTKDGETLYSECDELKIKLSYLIDKLRDNQKIFGSGLMPYFKENGLDLMKDSVFKRANAMLTAQGALRLLLESTDDYIVSKKVLITGFGDVAENLGELLLRIGCEVNIKARSPKALLIAEMKGYGTSYIKYITRCRIEYACSMLKSGSSVIVSCFESGFNSLSNFNHTFKNTVGKSPRQYKRDLSENAIEKKA